MGIIVTWVVVLLKKNSYQNAWVKQEHMNKRTNARAKQERMNKRTNAWVKQERMNKVQMLGSKKITWK
jgi:hypothetical protein